MSMRRKKSVYILVVALKQQSVCSGLWLDDDLVVVLCTKGKVVSDIKLWIGN